MTPRRDQSPAAGGGGHRSTTVTAWPRRAKLSPQNNPTGPAPTTTACTPTPAAGDHFPPPATAEPYRASGTSPHGAVPSGRAATTSTAAAPRTATPIGGRQPPRPGTQGAISDVDRDGAVGPDGQRPLDQQRLAVLGPPLVPGGADVLD